ncbi:phospholipid-transporting ATPase IK [Turdus rufiventris]|nr:phospholipid-transporting ATPase IK [Turdus rufiventris]
MGQEFKCQAKELIQHGGRGEGPGSGASMAEQEPATGCPGGKQRLPAFTWEVRANDRSYHRQFKKKFAFCLSKRKYSGNAIRTAKYNVLTFLPLNLYEQFHRMANVYFVFVILLQTFPEISTLPWYTLLFPLSCLLLIRGLRDLIDDIGRHRSDRSINSRPCEILAGSSFRWQKWRDICVGDIVRLRKDSVVPIFLVLLVTCLGLAVASGFWARTFQEKHSYLAALYEHTSPAQQAFLNFWGFTILLSIIIPMSMYITLEFIYLVNSCFINWDLEMYYGAKDIPAEARSTSLTDQLGQIEFIFSDKTGTLTQNIMSFKKCCINGTIYGNPDQLVYQAASPDEEALVLAARNLGYVFLARTQDTITIRELGRTRTYEVLAMLDFNSDRKRMSVLVRDPQGTIRLYTKGADSVILERLQRRGHNESLTERALDRFAEETLRTLCVASREVSEAEFHNWSQRHREATVLLQDRAQELDRLYEEMEQNLQLLGATAIEDKLQDGVPETIQLLKLGNIKVWVLTGDKQETAMNIGYACRLLTDDMEILEEKEVSEILQAYWESNNNLSGSGDTSCSHHLSQQCPEAPCHKRAIIISGDFLDKMLQAGEVLKEKGWPRRWLCCDGAEASQDQAGLVEKAFVELASSCQAVICCRVTPKQKALMVQLVKKHKKAVTLAIGDGANDVNMIKTADIGVGISGLEGLQAVQCSDYALAQFSFLQRLLLVHGRWNYLRICKFLRCFFYKTFAGLLTQVWFAFHSGFTAQPLYEGWFLALYNIFYTAYPVLSVGLLEQQDVSAKKSLEFPELYMVGQQDELFNYRVFGVTLLQGVGTSLISFYITLWAFEDHVGTKAVGDYESFSVTVALSALLSVLMEIVLDTQYWTVLSFVTVTASLLLFCLFSFLTQSIDAFRIAPAIFRFPDASWNALTDPYVLLVVLLSLVVNTLPSLTVRAFRATLGRASTQQEGRGGGAGGGRITQEVDSGHLQKAPKPFQSALRPSGSSTERLEKDMEQSLSLGASP